MKTTLVNKETKNLINYMRNGIELYKNGKYKESIEKLTDAIISIGLLNEKHGSELKIMRLEDMMLVAEGYQIKNYFKLSEENPSMCNEIEKKMIEIAKGEPTDNNVYFNKMVMVLKEWGKPGFWTKGLSNKITPKKLK